jgi:hypothetical protein
MNKSSSLDFNTSPRYKNPDYLVRRKSERIVLGGGECVVSADFLELEIENNSKFDLSRIKSPRFSDQRGNWLEGKLMHNRECDSAEGIDSAADSNGFLEKESIKIDLPGLHDKKEHLYREICSVFDVIDIDRDNQISRQELNENLTCHPSIASMLGIEDETDLRIKIGLLFRTKYGDQPCKMDDTVDKATFTSFFLCSNEECDPRNPADDSPIPILAANDYADYDSVPGNRENLHSSKKNSVNFSPKHQLVESPVAWLNESALDCWTSSASGNITKVSSGANTIVHTSISSSSELLQDPDSWPVREVSDSVGYEAASRRKRNSDFESRYHVSAESIMELLQGNDDILLETFLVIPAETSQDTVNQALSWPLAKTSFLMEF